MAGGKQSPRQRMVNLMYLVFIAMLAMNMSKEVLSAFGLMNEKLSESNTRATEKNNASYETLALKASEQAKQYGEAKVKTDKLRGMADEFFAYIGDLKTKMTTEIEDKKAYESMDKSGFLDQYFFASGKITPKGKEFVDKVNQFREQSLVVLGESELSSVVLLVLVQVMLQIKKGKK